MRAKAIIWILTILIMISSASALSELVWYRGDLGFNDSGSANIDLTNSGVTINSSPIKIYNYSYYNSNPAGNNINATGTGTTISGNVNLTCGYWIYPLSTFAAGDWAVIDMGRWTGTGNAATFGFENGEAGFFGYSNNAFIAGAITANKWTQYVTIYNTATQNITVYKNGTILGSERLTNPQNINGSEITLMNREIGGFLGGFLAQDIRCYNFTLTTTEVSNWYNNGTGTLEAYPFGQAATPTMTFTTNTTADNTARFWTSPYIDVQTLQSNIQGYINTTIKLYNSTGAILNTTIGTNNLTTVNYTGLSIGVYYFNATATNGTDSLFTSTRTVTIYNLTIGNITYPVNNQNISRFLTVNWTNATGSTISNYSVGLLNSDYSLNRTLTTVLANSYTVDLLPFNLSIGQYYVRVEAWDVNNFNVSTYNSINIISNAVLNISAINITGGSITSFSVDVLAVNSSLTYNYSTSSSIISADIVKGYVYSLFFNVSGYAYNTSIYLSNSSNFQNYQVRLFPNNGINISVFKELDGSILNVNTSVVLVGDLGSVLSYTLNKSRVIYGLTPDTYTLTASASTYSPRMYRVVVPEGSFQYVNVYLNNGTATLFNFKTGSGTLLEGVTFYVYTGVNGNLTLVESSISDITGRSQVYLESNKYYSFLAVKEGYNNYSFSLNPVSFTSYDVILTPSTTGSVIVPSAVVVSSPNNFFTYQNVHFSIEFISQYDSLDSYNFNISYPGGSSIGNGTSTHGEEFNRDFRITSGGNVILFYQYNLSNGGYFNRTITYPIVITASNRTWANMGNEVNETTGQDATTGYYVGERVLIVTFLSIVMFGVGWLIAGAAAGLFFAMIPILFFVGVGFVPKQLYYITFFFIVVYLISRGSDT